MSGKNQLTRAAIAAQITCIFAQRYEEAVKTDNQAVVRLFDIDAVAVFHTADVLCQLCDVTVDRSEGLVSAVSLVESVMSELKEWLITKAAN